MRAALAEVLEPFRHDGRLHKPLLILFVLVNALVLVNAVLHNPRRGYDAKDHLDYIKTLAEQRRIPTCADTAQCYIPPLPYMLPALLMATGHVSLEQAAKLAQLTNVLIALALTYYLLKICALLRPHDIRLRISSLLLFGMLPVFYKTFSLIRGEVYLPLLIVFLAYTLLSIFVGGKVTVANILFAGAALGLAVLARQWGLLMVPAVAIFMLYIWFRDHSQLHTILFVGLACAIIPVVVAGWYYGIMLGRYGTLTAWDRPASKLSLSVFPPEFYFGLGSGKLFTDPVRPSFSNQFPAIFYSDTWGDYSGYFLIYLKDTTTGRYLSGKEQERVLGSGTPLPAHMVTNRFTLNRYLGEVNLVSLLPSLILIGGLVYSVIMLRRLLQKERPEPAAEASLLFLLIVVFSMAGYTWYLLRYQHAGAGGDLIKATHMMQIFPFLGLLGGQLLARLDARQPRLWLGLMILLGVVLLHNLPAMVTHYPILP
jgi:4-amino-4-deoxy-L-arabinose transferase-like glycosyltransferase